MGLTPICASQGFHHFSGCECEIIKNVCFSTFLVAVQDSTKIDFKSVIAGYLGKGVLDKAGNLKTEEIKKLIEQSQATEKKDKENK